MIERVTDAETLAALLKANAPAGLIDSNFDPGAWATNEHIIALRIENDLGMFENWWPGVALAHVWFQSRGPQALERARAILEHLFANYGIHTLIGETPVQCRAALKFSERLGFNPIGEKMKPQGRVIVSLLIANLFHDRLVA